MPDLRHFFPKEILVHVRSGELVMEFDAVAIEELAKPNLHVGTFHAIMESN